MYRSHFALACASLYVFLISMPLLCSQTGTSISNAVVIDNNQRIVLAGTAQDFNTNSTDFAAARYNSDGTIDATFNPLTLNGVQPGQVGQILFDISGSNDGANAVAIDHNNKIIMAGFTTVTTPQNLSSQPSTSFALIRLNEDGSLDTTFNGLNLPNRFPGAPGTAIIAISPLSDFATALAIDSNNRIVVVGNTDNGTDQDVAIVRLLETGQFDTTFDSGMPTSTITTVTPGMITINVQGTNDTATSVALDALDNIYIGGYSNNGTNNDFMIIKLNNDGTLDRTFNQFSLTPGIALPGIVDFDNRANSLKVDSQNNILIGGFSNSGVATTFALMKLLPSGTLNTTFNPVPTGFEQPGIVLTSISNVDDEITGVALDSTNKIVVTGFSNNGINRAFATARYNTDGTLDTQTFNPAGMGARPGVVVTNIAPADTSTIRTVDNAAHAIALLNSSQIIVTGFSNDGRQINFTTVSYLPNGQLNTSGFNTSLTQPGQQGIVFTIFGVQSLAVGNGLPLFIGGDLSQIAAPLLEDLRTPHVPVTPAFTLEGPLVTNEYQPTIAGTASPNAVISLYVNGIPVNTVLADAGGNWTAETIPLFDGTYSLIVEASDPLTGFSLASFPLELTIDTVPPQIPAIIIPQAEDIIRNERVSVQGRSEPYNVLHVFVDGIQVAQATSNNVGLWMTITSPLQDGYHTLFVTATDLAGNVSEPSEPLSFTLDTGAARIPTIVSPVANEFYKSNEVLVQGEGKVNSTIMLFLNDKSIGSVKVDRKGHWAKTLLNLKDGIYGIRAATVDTLLKSNTISFTVDTIPPEPVQLSAEMPRNGIVSGTAEPEGLITVYLDGKLFGTTLVDKKGQWSFAPPTDQRIAHGIHTIKVSVTNKAGNVSSFTEETINV